MSQRTRLRTASDRVSGRLPRVARDGGDSPLRPQLRYVLLRVVIYLATLIPYILIYSTKERALVIAPPIALLGGLGTWLLLRDSGVALREQVLYAAVVALVLAELTWAFGYWTVAPIIGGAAIWLAFYVLSGIAEQSATGRLDRRTTLEYAAVSLIGVVVVLVSAPWAP